MSVTATNNRPITIRNRDKPRLSRRSGAIFFFLLINLALGFDVEFTGNRFFSSHYLLAGYGAARNEREVEGLIEHILDLYSDAGFPFCRIAPRAIFDDDTLSRIVLNINEGERVVVSDYLYDIKGRTDVAALKRLVRLSGGEYFSQPTLTRTRNAMLKTGVFDEINEDIVYRDDRYFVLFRITEKKSDYINAASSLAEEDLHFAATFYSLNLLGTLRRFQFRYEYQKIFALHFTEPILIAPSVFDLDFSIWTEDSARLIRFLGGFKTPLGPRLNLALSTGLELASYYNAGEDVRHARHNLLGLGLDLDLSTMTFASVHSINFECLLRTHDRWQIKYDGALAIKGWSLRPHYHWIHTGAFEYFDYLRIGGARDMRGYGEEEFITRKAWWVNLEYRRFFIFPLIDCGLIGDDVRLSYGFGIAAQSTLAQTSLVLAWPRPGGWRQGKLHLVFEKDF